LLKLARAPVELVRRLGDLRAFVRADPAEVARDLLKRLGR
jgi:hypothetical protein